ncbi:MAG TPA: type VI secretion system tube protein Hcp [Mucilaginibacter sp.]|jgi:type VI secretion system secreted protein Hcp|nr:type VI secretion system tube protein Hcp [Mucilaginibacter sp.]
MKKNQFYLLVMLVLVLQFPVLLAAAQTDPVVAYVTIQSAKGGQIKGNATSKGNEGKIECIGFMYSVKIPRDASSGMATGKTQPGNIVLVKYFDNTTPLLMQAALTNEELTSVTIEFYKKEGDGRLVLSQTIKLTNAFISQISQFAGTISPDKTVLPTEEISFTASKIEYGGSGNTTPVSSGGGLSKFNTIENKKN